MVFVRVRFPADFFMRTGFTFPVPLLTLSISVSIKCVSILSISITSKTYLEQYRTLRSIFLHPRHAISFVPLGRRASLLPQPQQEWAWPVALSAVLKSRTDLANSFRRWGSLNAVFRAFW